GIDPYSRCNTAHDGRGLFIRDTPAMEESPGFDPSESVIYEMHLRDFTIDPQSGVHHKGKYLGSAEVGTRHARFKEIKTGLDHLLELGINTVQILPVQDFENDESSDTYNWGYMPVHFNSPDGWYATDTRGPQRVTELKRLVNALHKNGIKVVMDVVYNHTAESGGKEYGLSAMADGYYYRRKPDGAYWDGSACGNEFKSESPMAGKFMLDSLKYWVREYKIDGFRFDLMALIDRETMAEIVRELKSMKEDILIYGEPWAPGATPVAKIEKGSQRSAGFTIFNDNFRDAVKGNVFDLSPGYVQAGLNRDGVIAGIRGSIDDFTDSPLETVNYVSCHDNHTLWDRINLSVEDDVPPEMRVDMDKLANAIILTSQGIPFLHSGEEFLRSKNGAENSYNLPDSVNKIDWELKNAHNDVFKYYRGLIELRKKHPAFRMKTAEAVRKNLRFYEETGLPSTEPGIAYVIDGAAAGDLWREIVVLINPSWEKKEFRLPKGFFKVAADGRQTYAGWGKPVSGKIGVAPVSLMVLYKQ
ncbi:MAG: type I pullulanase, partial [bacterium]